VQIKGKTSNLRSHHILDMLETSFLDRSVGILNPHDNFHPSDQSKVELLVVGVHVFER
jgi:hypothetical protein